MDQSKKNQKWDSDQEEEEDNMEIEPINIDQKMKKQQGMEDEADWIDEDKIELDFVFLDPNPNQFNSIKVFANSFLDGLSYKSSELAEMIINQVQIGTMVGTEEDEDQPSYKQKEQDVFGFITILNLQTYQKSAVIKEILSFVQEKSQKHNQQCHQQLTSILAQNKVGLLLNERILNLAPQVIPVLHNQLCEDLKWLQQENAQDFKDFELDYLLVITKAYRAQDANLKKKVKSTGSLQLKEIIYQKFEDYLFLNSAVFYFSFEAHSRFSSSGVSGQLEKNQTEEICYRIIYLIPFKEYLQKQQLIKDQIQ